jgi:hypothetical protein
MCPVISALLLATAAPALAQDGLNLNLQLPDGVNWSQVTNKVVGAAYSREWVPAGQDVDTTRWLITQQKVAYDGRGDAEDFLEDIFSLSDDACKSTLHDDIEAVRINGIRGAVGRTMCGHAIGTDHGAFYDRAVFVEGGFAYIVTSELRMPPMIVDGVLSFGTSDDPRSQRAKEEFIVRESGSRTLMLEGIRIE